MRLCPSANAVTGQGLGEVTNEVRNGAGNPVLDDVAYLPTDNQSPQPTQDPGEAALLLGKIASGGQGQGENRLGGPGGGDHRLGAAGGEQRKTALGSSTDEPLEGRGAGKGVLGWPGPRGKPLWGSGGVGMNVLVFMPCHLTSPGCRTRRAGAAFAAPGKRRDRPRIGRSERSERSRQTGVM